MDLKELTCDIFHLGKGVMVLKGVLLDDFDLGGCSCFERNYFQPFRFGRMCGLERTYFQQFPICEDVVVLKGLISRVFTF